MDPGTATEDCFIMIGGNYCYPTGSDDAVRASDHQAEYYPDFPNPWETRPVNVTETTEPQELECFILVGGNYCFPAGSPDAQRAAVDQAHYLRWTDTAMAAQEAGSAPEATVMVNTSSYSPPITELPVTGVGEVILIGALVCTTLGAILTAAVRRSEP